jgi:hypothetical protein
MWFVALALVIGVGAGLLASGSVFHMALIGVLVGAGVLLVGLFILLGRAGSSDPEP